MIFQSQPLINPILDIPPAIVIKIEETKPEEQKPVLYTIVPGDSLVKIAKSQGTTVDRLWDANTSLTNPDLIEPDVQLIIPLPDQELVDRPYPAQNTPTAPQNSPQRASFSSAGNTYTPGYCTEFAKDMRPDLPNRMGDAWKWPSSARAAGFSVGTVPRVGAIAQLGNHVSYVVSVNSNGTFNVREQNWVGLGIVSNRSNISPAGYQFIY